jgi:CRP/FNR family transcriptional regulator, cyclic AMP receptor protein
MSPQTDDVAGALAGRDLGRFTRRHAAGATIFEAGSVGRCMYVVLEGEVEIRIHDGQNEVTVNRLRSGECFGEIALLEQGVRMASAVATANPTVVVEIDKPRFVYLVGQQPAFALTVMRGLARRVQGRSR